MSNAVNAVNTIKELEIEFQNIETTTMKNIMDAFVRLSEKHGGVPFKSLPEEFALTTKDGKELILHVHAATFATSTGEVAFAATMFDDASSQFAGIQSNAPQWPEWLNTIVRHLHNGTLEELRAHPGISPVRH
ncbi:MAG: hypothetical protein DI628_06615 [Blastochloris viridis]|uniref:Uncharacterized protein n=1 Tax=Blastochloris viridis TaxID=1079 RepID=A0A6N4RBX5_BLAVI|nr:MAG: hypothetical protein DI628_06615 [Blastochloris viridis]